MGVQRVYGSATLRARSYDELRGYDAPVDNMLASLHVSNEEGWFIFDSSDTRADDGIDIIKPDDATPGSWKRTDFGLAKMSNAQRVDEENGGNTLYVGDALPGTTTSSAAWRIKRITFTVDVGGNTDSITEWADGNSNRDNVWDDRLSLIYS